MFKNHSDITEALQARIDQLAETGGGEILIPPGHYHFRPIRLRSRICLYLAAGAKLSASPRRENYFPIGYDHNEMGQVFSALYAFGETGVTLRGEGEIDLNGESFYEMDNPRLPRTVGPPITEAHMAESARNYQWRVNQPIFFDRCENVRFEGITIRNAPCWTLSFNRCRIVKMLNLTIQNSLLIPNSDGMHFTCSSDILISGCAITAGDDCVALTAITDWSLPCENVVITNCVFQSASKAISVGYMHSIVRNVLITNVLVKKSNRAFVVMCHPSTGLVENLRVSDCILEGRSYGGNWWGNGEPIVLMATPHHIERYRDPLPDPRFDMAMRHLFFSQITCRGERPVAVVASEPMVQNLHLRDMMIEIVPEEKPSLKGNAIDLAPGPENYFIPRPNVGLYCRNARPVVERVMDAHGEPVDAIFE